MAINWYRKIYGGRIVILAPKKEQAQIIMDYVMQHVFDHPVFQERLMDVESVEDRMRTKKSNDRLIWSDNSEIRVLSAGATRRKDAGQSIMGFGGDLIISDESALIPDNIYSKILRMLGGNLERSKIVKIGNPFNRNHFYRSSNDPRYDRIRIDYKQAIEEGRLTQAFIEEMKASMPPEDFRVLYEVKYPEKNSANSIFTHRHWEQLLSNHVRIQKKILKIKEDQSPILKKFAEPEEDDEEEIETYEPYFYAGLDVAGGGPDLSVLTIVEFSIYGVVIVSQEPIDISDTHQMALEVHNKINGKVEAIGIDSVGIGIGVGDHMENINDREYIVHRYVAGSRPIRTFYDNRKTELLFTLRQLIEESRASLDESIGQLRKDLLGYDKERRIGKLKSSDPDDSPDYGDSLLAALDACESVKPANIEFF